MIHLAIIEDDERIRSWITEGVENDPEFSCPFCAGSAEQFLKKYSFRHKIDAILLDINLPGTSGLDFIESLKELLPGTEIIMYTVYDDSQKIFEAIRSGAKGYLLKTASIEDLKESVRQVIRGEAALNPSVARKILNYFHPNHSSDTSLTPREKEVVELLVEGLFYKEIADRLEVSINTVNFHVRNIYKKLQVNSRGEIINKKLRGRL